MKDLLLKVAFGISGAASQALMLWALFFAFNDTDDWPRAAVFIVVWCVNIVAVCLVSSTEVLRQRMWPFRGGQHAVRADLIWAAVMAPLLIAWLFLLSWDAYDGEVLPRPPVAVAAIGLALVVVGWVFMTLATRQNEFASTLVQVQAAREQTVIDTGVYAIVRHPMYAGAVSLGVGLPLWLRSTLGTLLAVVLLTGLCWRITIEERVLRRGLAGYDAYTERVRHRLVPGIW